MRQDLVYPDILEEYFKFCKVRNSALKSKVVNLSQYNWMYPTFITPLWGLLTNNDLACKMPRNKKVYNYFYLVLTAGYSKGATYIPLQYLPKNSNDFKYILSNLQEWCNNGENYGGANAFNFVLEELMDNIYQHSDFNNACVLAQNYPSKQFAEISIFDDGISIPGCFESAGISYESDAHAIHQAIKGVSTKHEDRGRGLNDSIDMYTRGAKAEALIVSRNGIFYKKHREPVKLYNTQLMSTTSDITKKGYELLDKNYVPSLEGTLISLRINALSNTKNRNSNIYKIIKVIVNAYIFI